MNLEEQIDLRGTFTKEKLSVFFDEENKGFFEKIQEKYGGEIFDIFWRIKLTKEFLLEIIPNLKKTKHQAMSAFYYLSENDKWKEENKFASYDFNFDDYQSLASFTASYPDKDWMTYLTLGLSGESGEVSEKVKKIIRGDMELTKESAAAIYKEISDICWYASNFCFELSKKFPEENFSYSNMHLLNLEKLFSRYIRNKIKGNGDNR